jgi:hypothetical protein
MLSANSSLPFISGRSKSTMRHVSAFGIALAISALGRSKARTLKPAFGSISTERVERTGRRPRLRPLGPRLLLVGMSYERVCRRLSSAV